MEWKRTRLRVISKDGEEEEEEDWNRRISPRKRKRVRYIEPCDDDEEEEEEEEDEEDNEQSGPSTQNTNNQRLLPVTCGNKKGVLDVEKLHWGEECIKCEGCWFSAPAFEDFGGKGSCKKWKTSIFHENKPLQFWFEQGSLTTKGYKRRGTETTKKMLSSNRISESPTKESEIQSAEDDVSDEDLLPGSEELALETEEGEEERVGAENGGEVVDAGVDKSKEEEDEMEKGGMEDEDMPAVADNDKDNSVSEDRGTKLIISASEKIRENALQKKVKVVIERLPEFQAKSGRQSNGMKHPVVDSWCKPLDKDVQNEEEREHSGSATDDPSSITASTHTDPSQMSHPPTGGGVEEENGEEFTQSSERKEDGQREINTETGHSPTPLSVPATSSLDIEPETQDIRSTSSHTTNLSSPPVLLVTMTGFIGDVINDWEEREETGHGGKEEEEGRRSEMGPETQRRWIKGFEDEHLDSMSRSEAGGQPLATGNTRDAASNTSSMQRGIKEESIEAMSGGLPTKPQSVLDECKYENRDAATSGQTPETGVPQITQVSGITPSPDMEEGPSSRPSSSSDLDTMDLDQLRREKIKMQLKVLQLQEEYYTQKIKEHKK